MNKITKPIFKNLIQVGIVVKNLEQAMKKYVYDYGIGPMYVIKFSHDNVSDMFLHGKKKDYSMNIGVCPVGDVRFELIEPLSQSIYSEFYKTYGEGIINHLKIETANYQDTMEYLKSCGIKILQKGSQSGGPGSNKYNYFSTCSKLGFILEIVDVTHDFIKPEPDYLYPENKEDIPRPIFKRPTQVGIVVRKLKEKIKEYESIYKIGPWRIEKYNSSNVKDMHVYGERKDYSMDMAFCTMGNTQFKLIEPKDKSMYSKFLDRYGGVFINHLRMEIDNYHQTLKYLKTKNIEVVQSGSYLGQVEYSYLSTSKDISFITEIIESKDKEIMAFCP